MEYILIGLIIFLLGTIVLLLVRGSQGNTNVKELQGALQQLNQQQSQQLQHTTNLVLQQLNKQQESTERTSSLMHTRIDQATRVVSDVQSKLSQMEESTKRIFDLGKDISSLQRILQAPKLRGTMGEIWLADLIGQIIPAERFKMQYSFKSGEACDAVIFLRDEMLLPIDAKFSLENFVKMLEAEEADKTAHRKQFASDVKKRIDEIAKKYILPQERTLEFAFMYVPAENVYYQAFIQDEDSMQLLSYAFSKHIIPVSPSSFYAYLQVILFGLHGMEIEKSAKQIQKNLSGLQVDFLRLHEAHDKVGVHLRHAGSAFEQSEKRLGNLDGKLRHIAAADQELLEKEEVLHITTADAE